MAHQLHKAQGEAETWRRRYETAGLGKIEEMEMAKMKMAARLSENQGTVEQLQLKLAQVDKRKLKVQQVRGTLRSDLKQTIIVFALGRVSHE